jgi:hypothetical protein
LPQVADPPTDGQLVRSGGCGNLFLGNGVRLTDRCRAAL